MLFLSCDSGAVAIDLEEANLKFAENQPFILLWLGFGAVARPGLRKMNVLSCKCWELLLVSDPMLDSQKAKQP